MALAGAGVLADALLAVPRSTSKADAVKNVVDAIGDYMDELQAGGGGSSGIFKLNRPAMIAELMKQSPTTSGDWGLNFATAWEKGVSGAVLTPGTVSNPAWIGSGGSDVLPPVITNAPAGKAVLAAELKKVKPTIPAPMPMASAVHKATTTLIFIVTGLSAPPALAPIPLPFPAQ